MIDKNKRYEKERAKDKQRRRIHVEIDPDNYDYIPEVKQTDYYDNDVPQRVAIYVRVSTDDVRQTTSFELQKKYYEDFVVKHPHWTLVKIYADEGISGTSLNKREQFLEMIADAKRGKIDMIITKSVSRFARNVVDFIGIVRDLAERNPAQFMQYKATRPPVQGKYETAAGDTPTGPSVKDMPEYDPDAEISSLTLTIPSWKSSIERAKNTADLAIVSPQAKDNLAQALRELRNTIADMLSEVEDI